MNHPILEGYLHQRIFPSLSLRPSEEAQPCQGYFNIGAWTLDLDTFFYKMAEGRCVQRTSRTFIHELPKVPNAHPYKLNGPKSLNGRASLPTDPEPGTMVLWAWR